MTSGRDGADGSAGSVVPAGRAGVGVERGLAVLDGEALAPFGTAGRGVGAVGVPAASSREARRGATGARGVLIEGMLQEAATLRPVRALVAEGPGIASLREVPEPRAGPGEVVVAVKAALTCGTDLKLLRRGHPKLPFPLVLGHELAGEVSDAGEGAPFSPGERVACGVTGPCGECAECRRGLENLCATAFDAPAWGAFAERVRLPARVVARSLFRIGDALGFEAAALLDPAASVLRGIARLPLSGGPEVLVRGSGPIALIFASLLLGRGASRVLVAARRRERFPLFEEAGAEVLDASAGDLRAALLDVTSGRGAGAVVDTTGEPSLVPQSLDLVARGGTLLLFAGMPRDATLALSSYRIHYDEVTVSGSFHYRPSDSREALDLLAEGALPVGRLVTERRPLAEWAAAFDALARGEGMKTALVP